MYLGHASIQDSTRFRVLYCQCCVYFVCMCCSFDSLATPKDTWLKMEKLGTGLALAVCQPTHVYWHTVPIPRADDGARRGEESVSVLPL